ncbi:serine carboxypeptidase [Mycena albidolilacea]|uniref:Carboxypeptidase n=1 Tax=Mycena albidolilacea TaxID=1033008 RepID=A0AAD7EMB7_9AGAR|nr:serine carboxypeptidase [Mycena albidolilacea]
MLFPWALLASVPSAVLGLKSPGQVPIRNGVVGGVRNKTVKAELLQSFATTPGKLRATENSGICETTKNVYQASGYGDLTSKESVWFWYFDARTNASTAPLTLWFNGGPGSSSMIGLLQELGPCRIANDSRTVTLNPYSWNNEANVLFIDQPVGVGFSHGTESVGTSEEAAADVWKFLQIFLADSRFAHLAANDLAIWTESYGGHYGPNFASYFLSQNAAIAAGTATGLTLNLKTLGIGNGLTDPLSQYPGYISYANANPYERLVSTSVISKANASWSSSTGCKAQITKCGNGGSNSVCSAAQNYCNNNILSPLVGDHDIYYVLADEDDAYPPDITSYLASVASKIGAEVTWQMTNDDVYNNFAETGDWMRSALPALESVIDAGIRVLIYNGDADFIVNYQGVEDMLAVMKTASSAEFNKAALQTYTVAGHSAGLFKTAGNVSYVRIAEAGHEVPAYKNTGLAYGQAAYQFFTQTMANQSLFST